MPAEQTATQNQFMSVGSTPDAPTVGVRNLGKVTPPTIQGVYRNRRLFARLEAGSSKPVLWIHGPPGAGKTTLAASYLATLGIDPLWYRLDAGDADPATLFVYLAAARKPGGRPLPLLTPEHRGALPLFARRYFGGLLSCPRTAAIVFDDYHEIAPDAPVHACFAAGLEEVPAGRRVIVASRAPPPPPLARLRVNGLIEVIEPEALSLTPDEADGLARQRGRDASRVTLERIIRRTHGWTAGVILMLEVDGAVAANVHAEAPVPEVLFDYFASEVLQRFGSRVQRLLCTLALMPTTTVAAAERLTGDTEVGAFLEDLRRRNYFTTRDTGEQPHYRFHPLFREFLLGNLSRHVTPHELDDLRVRAAEVLEANGQPDGAVSLLVQAKAHGRLIALVKRQAARLVDEHRYDTLSAWFANLPDPLIYEDAWLSYWFGAAHVQSDSVRSLRGFCRAFEMFEAAGDVTGQFLSWAGQAQAVWTDAFGSMARFDPLIVSLRALIARHPDFPSPGVALKVSSLMSTALTRRGNDRAEIETWQRRARVAAETVPGAGQSDALGFMFAINDIHDANFAAASVALTELPDPFTLDHLPFTQTPGMIAHMMFMLYRQSTRDTMAYGLEAIRRIEDAGNDRWTPLIAGFLASDALRRGDLKGAEEWLGRMAAYADRVAPTRGAQYHFTFAHLLLHRSELAAAARHADMAVESAVRTGWYFFEGYARWVRAEILVEEGDLDGADAELHRLRGVLAASVSALLEFPTALLEAEVRLARRDRRGGLAALATAMATGRRDGSRRGFLARPRLAALCALALNSGIEPEFVRALIRASEIPPPDEADETWPWPVRITTFGGLRIELDGTVLTFTRKTPKRLVALLKALVAYGGIDVPEEKLVDAVWPDEDGDAGHRALTVAVHRLRKLLDDSGVLTVKGGRVGLDPSRCWLDIWVFERRLARRAPCETEGSYRNRVERGLALHAGEFLAGDDAWWLIEARDRLHEMYMRGRRAVPRPSA